MDAMPQQRPERAARGACIRRDDVSYEPSPKDVMALRNKTGLPMMECKKALVEANGDMEEAENILRKKLKGKMDTRTDRAAGEGCIAIAVSANGHDAAITELRAETDFTAKNDLFQSMAEKVVQEALKAPAGNVTATPGITAAVDAVRISTSENVSMARAKKLSGGPGTKFGFYIHHDKKQGSLVQAEGNVPDEALKTICQHIVAKSSTMPPLGVTPNDIPADVAEKERKFAIEQAMESGKPREIAEKMVEGKMRKFFEDVALIEQALIMDESKKVKDLLPAGTTIKAFVGWKVGGA